MHHDLEKSNPTDFPRIGEREVYGVNTATDHDKIRKKGGQYGALVKTLFFDGEITVKKDILIKRKFSKIGDNLSRQRDNRRRRLYALSAFCECPPLPSRASTKRDLSPAARGGPGRLHAVTDGEYEAGASTMDVVSRCERIKNRAYRRSQSSLDKDSTAKRFPHRRAARHGAVFVRGRHGSVRQSMFDA
jgi:hypothetical protein